MSSQPNENAASSTENPPTASVSAGSASGATAASGGNNKPTNLGLTGSLKKCEPVLATQPSRTSKELAERTKAMFKTFKITIKRFNASAKFTDNAEVTVDMSDGSSNVKPYIPISMRGDGSKIVLQHSKILKDHGCLSEELAGVKDLFLECDQAYEDYKNNCAVIAGRVAELELTAAKKLLGHQFMDMLYSTSTAFAISIRKSKTYKGSVTADTMCREYMAHAAAYLFITTIHQHRPHYWKQLRVFKNGGSEAELKELLNVYSNTTGINYDQDCKPTLENEFYPETDKNIVTDITEALVDAIPKLTVDVWEEYDETVIDKDEVDGELDEFFDKMKVDQANEDLDEDMDTRSPEEKVKDMIDSSVKSQLASAAAKKKQQARKNSGDDAAKSTASASTSNGRNSGRKSSPKRSTSRNRSPKRSRSPKATDATSTPERNRKGKNRRGKQGKGASPGGSDLVQSPHTTFRQSSGGRSQGGRGRGGRGNQEGARGGGRGNRQN